MPSFQYEALDKAGRKVRGVIEADSADAVTEKLRGSGYYPTRVVPSARKAGRSPATPGTGKPFFASRAVVQPAARPGVMILHSRQLMMRWMAGGLYLFAFVMAVAILSAPRTIEEKWGLGVFAAIGFVIAGILWTSPRRAEIDRTGGRLLVKPGLPNGKILQPRVAYELSRFRAVLLCAETSRIYTKIAGVPMNYIGVVCLIGPLDCVKILGYHAKDATAQRVARDAAEKVAQFLDLPLVDETQLHGIAEEPGDVVPHDCELTERDFEIAVSFSPAMRPGRIEGAVSIHVNNKSLPCRALIVQVVERIGVQKGMGHLRRVEWTIHIRDGVEIPLDVTIPAGEQRFVGYDFAAPLGFGPSTETHVWQIAARLIAPGIFVVPVGMEIDGDGMPT